MGYSAQQMQKAYVQQMPQTKSEVIEEKCPESYAESLGVKPDFGDKLYVMARTKVDSLILVSFIPLGAITFFVTAYVVKRWFDNLLNKWIKK